MISEGETVGLSESGGYFSLFAAGDEAVVSVSGAKYEGESITLSRAFPLGVSNETKGKTSVAVKRGEAFLVVEEKRA